MEQAVEYLYQLPKFTKKNPPEHTRELMRRLGDMQDHGKVLHVAGSNGKGSVCSFLSQMLLCGGKTVGLFTSPHLTDIRERFLINGELCTEADFLSAYAQVRTVIDEMQRDGYEHPTFFEMLFAIGMVIFAEAGVEYMVLETGLGGRLDATNIVKRPLLTVITSIGLEHTEYLGETIEEIAAEKAGIIKPGVPVVYDADDARAAAVIRARAEKLGAKSYAISKNFFKIYKIEEGHIDFSLLTDYDNDTVSGTFSIPFGAPYQVMNASLAITGFRRLFGVSEQTDAQIRAGLSQTRWPGRMQAVAEGIYLDGAHNAAGMDAFVQSVKELCAADLYPPLLFFSMVKEKDCESSAKALCGVPWEQITVTQIPDERGQSPRRLAEAFAQAGRPDVRVDADVRHAYAAVKQRKKDGQKLFCCGSLYFIGGIMALTEERHD